MRGGEVRWGSLDDEGFADLVALAGRCRAADGGLPVTAAPGFVRRRWTVEGSKTLVGRDIGGRLVAAAVVRPSGDGHVTVATLVDPDARGRGHGEELLDWGLREAGRRAGSAVVETEGLTPEQAALFAGRGLRQVFAEDVLRVDLTAPIAPAVWPEGAVTVPWTDGTALRFFAVYEAAFRERPGFPGHPAATWIGDLADDDDFRPAWSVLVELPGLGDAGFVTAAVDWIDQVGVIPEARRRGLASALTAESLARMRADGRTEAWLTVNVDNPAKSVYLGLGFLESGRRARFSASWPS
jgi:mycothiol synthase